MEIITEILGSYGFPIAVAIYLLITMERQRRENLEAMERQRQECREDSARWCEAINRNTSVMERLLDKIKGGAE